jgi:hypothetical protein
MGKFTSAVVAAFGFLIVFARAADVSTKPAQDLAARLSAIRQDGPSYVRLRLETKQPAANTNTVLQLQLKARRTETTTELVYQVLWPKERKGESILLKKTTGHPPTGFAFSPPDTLRPIDTAQMKEPAFGSDLSCADLIENFFAWEHQALIGREVVNGVQCDVLQSRPTKADRSPYVEVRTWIDPTRLVPLRVEKDFATGGGGRRINTAKVVKDDAGHFIPAGLVVQRTGSDSVTELEGSSSKRGVAYAEKEFTPEGLKEVTTPRSSPE